VRCHGDKPYLRNFSIWLGTSFAKEEEKRPMNLLENLTKETLSARSLAWEHAPLDWEALPDGGIRVHVPGKTDYFQDPAGVIQKDDAPYLWLPFEGDFVAQAHVRPNWVTVWDAAVLMVRHDPTHWAKICFESTDIGTTAAVSVVTNGHSDDANGADLTTKDVWLQICRSGNTFGLHYALDGKSWKMVRVFRLDLPARVKVGLVAQCPAGPGVAVDLLSFSIAAGPVKDLRAGI
jgi:uncharacterized protein